jgi:hypothetical protein
MNRSVVVLQGSLRTHATLHEFVIFREEVLAAEATAVEWNRWRREMPPPWAYYLSDVYGEKRPAPEPTFIWNTAPRTSTLVRYVGPQGLYAESHLSIGHDEGLTQPECERLLSTLPFVYGDSVSWHLSAYGFFLGRQALPLSAALPDGAWLEVIRITLPEADPSTRPESMAESSFANQVWYSRAQGSGIFLNVGRSLRVSNLEQLLEELHRTIPPAGRDTLQLRTISTHHGRVKVSANVTRLIGVLPLCEYVRHAGFDTVQITAAYSMAYEMIDCRDIAPTAAAKEQLVQLLTSPRESEQVLAQQWHAARPPQWHQDLNSYLRDEPKIVSFRPIHEHRIHRERELAFNVSSATRTMHPGRAVEVLWTSACPPVALHALYERSSRGAGGGASGLQAPSQSVMRTADGKPCVCSLQLPVLNCASLQKAIRWHDYNVTTQGTPLTAR